MIDYGEPLGPNYLRLNPWIRGEVFVKDGDLGRELRRGHDWDLLITREGTLVLLAPWVDVYTVAVYADPTKARANRTTTPAAS